MIDLHCHLLPGIDDGPDTLEESLALARIAVGNGITKAVLTPHIHPGRYHNDRDSISRDREAFAAALASHGIPLELGFAAEVRIGPEIMPLIEQDRIPFLGLHNGDRLLLLEFPHSHIPLGSEKFVAWLLSQKIRPLIAHPERNKDVIRNIDKINPFVEAGCLLQITAGALVGAFGPHAQLRAEQLLQRGWVSVIASDAHNSKTRPPAIEEGRKVAEGIVGSQKSWAMVLDTPGRFVKHATHV